MLSPFRHWGNIGPFFTQELSFSPQSVFVSHLPIALCYFKGREMREWTAAGDTFHLLLPAFLLALIYRHPHVSLQMDPVAA